MLYSVYCRRIKEEDQFFSNKIDDIIKYDWYILGNHLPPMEVMELLIQANSYPSEEDYIQIVLPELEFGNTVLNTKNNEVGKVIYFDQDPVQRFDEEYLDEDGAPIDTLYEYVTVETLDGDTVIWEMRDLIVIG